MENKLTDSNEELEFDVEMLLQELSEEVLFAKDIEKQC